MERRFAARLKELLDDATVDPAVLRDMLLLGMPPNATARGILFHGDIR